MAEKSLQDRMQNILDKDETYAELCKKVDEAKTNLDKLEKQYNCCQQKIKANETALAELGAKIHTVAPEDLDALKAKKYELEKQILFDKNWLLELSNNQHRGRLDEDRKALEVLQKERKDLFFRLVLSLRSQQTTKAENCLKQAVAYHRLWGEALGKVTVANHIRLVGSDDVFLSNSARNLGLDFTGHMTSSGVERFDFSVLVRRYQ